MHYKKAFTIIEVLLAAVLLAAGLVTVFSMANRAVFAHADLFKSGICYRLADETLAQVKVKLPSLPEKTTVLTGDFNDRLANTTWKAEIKPTDLPGLVNVNITINRPGLLADKEFTLSTLMYH